MLQTQELPKPGTKLESSGAQALKPATGEGRARTAAFAVKDVSVTFLKVNVSISTLQYQDKNPTMKPSKDNDNCHLHRNARIVPRTYESKNTG